jgi:hypothetical protein
MEKRISLVPTGVEPRTFQPTASRYTDYAAGPKPIVVLKLTREFEFDRVHPVV